MTKALNQECLIEELRGQIIIIPDFEAMLAHWPRAINPNLERLRAETKSRMDRLFTGERCRRMNLADMALLGAMWWPYGLFEDVCIANHLSTWLFAWDDETDSKEYSDIVHDLKRAAAFRTRTVNYIQECFTDEHKVRQSTSEQIISDFGPVGKGVFERYKSEQAQTFLHEVLRFIQATEIEQRRHTSGCMPTIEEYMHVRMSTSAVTPCLALNELCYGIELPRNIIMDPDMQKVWHATNIIISLMNDVLSMKKEILQGQVDSILPLLYLEHKSLETAMDIVKQWIADAVKDLDNAEVSIIRRYADSTHTSDIQKMINGCKYASTGNLNWSLICGRYKIGAASTRNGVSIQLM